MSSTTSSSNSSFDQTGGGQSLAQVPAYEYTAQDAQINPKQVMARTPMAFEARAIVRVNPWVPWEQV